MAFFMSKEFAARCRRTAAKLNNFALDHPMIAFASKEASWSTSSLTEGEKVKLKTTLRFLRKQTTITHRYVWQDHSGVLIGYTDSGWLAASPLGDPQVEESVYTVRTCCSSTHELKQLYLSRVPWLNCMLH